MSCWKWCITSPCSLVWIGCITLDKYWWVLSWGISFEVVKGCSIFFSPPADVLAAWLHTERAQQRTGKKWNSSSSYDIISWHLLLGTQEKGLCVCGGAGKLKHPKEQTNIEITKKEEEKVQNVPRSVALVCYEPVKHYVRGLVVFFLLYCQSTHWSDLLIAQPNVLG